METVFQLQLLDVKPGLEYLPPRAMLISSAVDYPKSEIHAQFMSPQQPNLASRLPTSKSEILQEDTLKKVRIMMTKVQIQEQYPNYLPELQKLLNH